MSIDLLTYSPKYSNKQGLIFTITKQIDDNFYNIKFEVDNFELYNVFKNNILSGICYHPNKEQYKVNTNTKLLYQNIYINSLQCKNRKEFSTKFNGSYRAAQKLNCLDELFEWYGGVSHKIEDVHKVALMCKTRGIFQKTYVNEYDYAHKKGWLETVCSHMEILQVSWTIDLCAIESIKYQTRKEFINGSYNAYQAALRHGWLDEICTHMKIPNSLDYLRIIYAYEFPDNYVYIGLTKDFKTREYARNNNINDPVTLHKNTTNKTPSIIYLTDYIPPLEAQNIEKEFIQEYKDNGWNILNRNSGGSLGGSNHSKK